MIERRIADILATSRYPVSQSVLRRIALEAADVAEEFYREVKTND